MFHPTIVERTLARFSDSKLKFVERSIDESKHLARQLHLKREKSGFDDKGNPRVQWTQAERAFMDSETLLCRASFRYWVERYAFAELDASEGGGVAPVTLWPSQERALEIISARELLNWQNFDKYGFSDGTHIVWHKTRQQGATALARLICMHRMTTRKNTRAIAATLDEKKIMELYTRDHVILDNLPFFLQPKIEFDVKNEHIGFELLKSRISYEQASQKAGIGTGQQFDISHMTEVALWPYANRLQFDFLPAVPKHPSVFVGWESTANGKGGFWYEFTENVRKRKPGFQQWVYSFTPWYINHNKNRLIPPEGWEPNEFTRAHGELIERTSVEFAGTTIRPNKTQLYWWETEYLLNQQQGTLHIFFSNYPATPEQSFQHTSNTALPVHTIEWMRSLADHTRFFPYHVEWAQ